MNPDILAGGHPHIATGLHEHKFGLDWSEARRLYLAHRNSKWIRWQGISAHIGSQIVTPQPFKQALKRVIGFVGELKKNGIDCGISTLAADWEFAIRMKEFLLVLRMRG